ncbi:MAG: inositol monophosphatase family protein [Candidatus Binatia bacterium]
MYESRNTRIARRCLGSGEPIATSAARKLDKALLATGFPYDHRENADFYLSYFKAFMTQCQGIRRGGSAALELSYVACGRLDGCWEMKLKPWDTAAGSLIVSEAGGKLSDFSGKPFRFGAVKHWPLTSAFMAKW